MCGRKIFCIRNDRSCVKKHVKFVTSIWAFRLFLKRNVFLLWPIERCKRGLSVRNSPELSSVGLVGLSWLVSVSPGRTVDDHVASTVLSRILLSTDHLLMLFFQSIQFEIAFETRENYLTFASCTWWSIWHITSSKCKLFLQHYKCILSWNSEIFLTVKFLWDRTYNRNSSLLMKFAILRVWFERVDSFTHFPCPWICVSEYFKIRYIDQKDSTTL